MHRILALFTLLSLPGTAHALGYGTSYGIGLESSSRGYYVSPFGIYPSLDLYSDGALVQLHPLELVQGITQDDIWLWANAYFPGPTFSTGTGLEGTIMPGASFDLRADTDFKPLYLALMAEGRMGVQTAEAMGVGVYVVPGLGLALADGDFEVMLGGRVEIAIWLP